MSHNNSAAYAAGSVEAIVAMRGGVAGLERDIDAGNGDVHFFWTGGLGTAEDAVGIFACISQENDGPLSVAVEIRTERGNGDPVGYGTGVEITTSTADLAVAAVVAAIFAIVAEAGL